MSGEAQAPSHFRYEYDTHVWVPRCPFGDECSGCDARGVCTKMEPDSFAARRAAVPSGEQPDDPMRAPQGFAADGDPPYGDDSGPSGGQPG